MTNQEKKGKCAFRCRNGIQDNMEHTEKRAILLGAKNWVEHNLPVSLNIRNESYSKLLILSTIDCFAQMWGNNPSKRNMETFCDFVLKYSSQCEKLRQVCPVTLHYHYKENDIIKLRQGMYDWDDPVLIEEADRILLSIDDMKIREEAKNKHTYIRLLYQLRNKVVHELDNIGTPNDLNRDIPFVVSGEEKQGERLWTFNYPRIWLYKLAQETIYGFIDDCLKSEETIRFLDGKRTTKLTWYI